MHGGRPPPATHDATPAAPGGGGGATPLQLALGAVLLGASAGLTLYTKRTGGMIAQLDRASRNAAVRQGPPKYGPKTKLEWERTRNRWESDDV